MLLLPTLDNFRTGSANACFGEGSVWLQPRGAPARQQFVSLAKSAIAREQTHQNLTYSVAICK